MAIPATAFREWLAQIGMPDGVSALAGVLDVRRSTIQKQLIRGRVQESLVVSASRSAHLDPIEELSKFDPYGDLLEKTTAPTRSELLSQISYEDVLRDLLYRIRPAYKDLLAPLARLSSIPHNGSVRAWFDAIDPGDLRRQVSGRAGIAPPNLSTQLTQGKLTPSLAVDAARVAEVSLANGLVVTGLITTTEGRWTDGMREAVLDSMQVSELIDQVREKLAILRRTVRRQEEEQSAEQRFLDNLG